MCDVGFGHALSTSELFVIDWKLKLTRPIGRIKRWVIVNTDPSVKEPMGLTSSLTGFLVKPSPTKVGLLTMRFQLFPLFFPVLMTLKISSSAIPRTLGNGTANLAALSFLRSLTAELNAFASYSKGQISSGNIRGIQANLLTLSIQ